MREFFGHYPEWQTSPDDTPYTKYYCPTAPTLNHEQDAISPVKAEELAIVIASNELQFSSTYLEPRLALSSGLRDDQGQLKAWALLHQDLGIGLVHTVDRCRGLGLAARVVTQTARNVNRELGALGLDVVSWFAHADTSPKNIAMTGLFAKLGWRPVSTKLWIVYNKVDPKMSDMSHPP